MGEHVDLKALRRVSPALPEGTRLSPTRIFARNAVCRSPVLQNTFKSVEEKRAAVAVRAGAVWFFDLSEHEQVGKGFRTGPKKRAVAETTPLLSDTIVRPRLPYFPLGRGQRKVGHTFLSGVSRNAWLPLSGQGVLKNRCKARE